MLHFESSKGPGEGKPTKAEARAAFDKYYDYMTPEQRGIFAHKWDLSNMSDTKKSDGTTDSSDKYTKDWAAGEQAMERQARNNFEQNAAYQV